MFRDRERTTSSDQVPRNDYTIADEGIGFTANLLPHRTGVRLPEISLAAAIFEDAVRCVQRTGRGVTHRQSSEASEWIASERHDWLFAFVNVCEFLGMDAKAVRKRLGVGDGGSGDAATPRVIASGAPDDDVA
jgi:hypothetical protein